MKSLQEVNTGTEAFSQLWWKIILSWCNKIPEYYISAIQANPQCSVLSVENIPLLMLAKKDGKRLEDETLIATELC